MKYLLTQTILLLVLLVPSSSFAQIKTAEEMTKTVFETIKNSDVKTFTGYCVSEEKMNLTVKNLKENSPMEKGIKQELKGTKAEEFKKETFENFNALLKELESKNIKPLTLEYKGITKTKNRFEVTNLKSSEIYFNISFKNINYQVSIDIFDTKDDLFIYGFHFHQIMDETKK